MLKLPTGEPGVKDNSYYHFIAPQIDIAENLFFPGCVGHYYLDGTYCFSHNILSEVKYPDSITRMGDKVYYNEEKSISVDIKYMFFYVVEGTMAIISGSPPTTTVCSRSSCIVVEHKRAHTYYACSDAEIYFVLFGGNHSEELLSKIMESGNVIPICHSFNFQNSISRIFTSAHENHTLDDLELSSLMYSLIAEVYVSAKKTHINKTGRFSQFVTYIQEHYKEPLAIEKLAKMAHVNVSHFALLFNQEVGVSTYEYLLQIRF